MLLAGLGLLGQAINVYQFVLQGGPASNVRCKYKSKLLCDECQIVVESLFVYAIGRHGKARQYHLELIRRAFDRDENNNRLRL
jgi:sulfite reductase beta subunit-like hemoprotein